MATVTLTIPDAELPRIRAAFGTYLGTVDVDNTPRPATGAEIKDWIARQIKIIVRHQEAEAAARIATAGPEADVS